MQHFRINIALIITIVILLVDTYTWRGISILLKNSSHKKRKIIKYIFFQLTIIFFILMLYMVLVADIPKAFRNYTIGMLFVIYLCKIFFIVFVFLNDVKLFIKFLIKKYIAKPKNIAEKNTNLDGNPENISRRNFILKTGVIASVAPLILLTNGIIKNAYNYQLRKIKLHLPNLPSGFRGVKILQLSDIHCGSFTDRDAVWNGIKMALMENPDLIFFTGDLVNNRTEEANEWMNMFAEIKAPMGVLSIFGNHDYGDYVTWQNENAKKKNLEDLEAMHKNLGWHLMRNEHVTIDLHGQRIAIAGVENWGNQKRFPKYGDLKIAMKNIPDVPVKMLLSHDPSHWDAKVRNETPDVDVTFSGHTHGFQFGIENKYFKWSPSQWAYEQWAGLYEKEKQKLYVNRGFGFLGYPGRVGILPEITVFELV